MCLVEVNNYTLKYTSILYGIVHINKNIYLPIQRKCVHLFFLFHIHDYSENVLSMSIL